jgi:hypothetical protein
VPFSFIASGVVLREVDSGLKIRVYQQRSAIGCWHLVPHLLVDARKNSVAPGGNRRCTNRRVGSLRMERAGLRKSEQAQRLPPLEDRASGVRLKREVSSWLLPWMLFRSRRVSRSCDSITKNIRGLPSWLPTSEILIRMRMQHTDQKNESIEFEPS